MEDRLGGRGFKNVWNARIWRCTRNSRKTCHNLKLFRPLPRFASEWANHQNQLKNTNNCCVTLFKTKWAVLNKHSAARDHWHFSNGIRLRIKIETPKNSPFLIFEFECLAPYGHVQRQRWQWCHASSNRHEPRCPTKTFGRVTGGQCGFIYHVIALCWLARVPADATRAAAPFNSVHFRRSKYKNVHHFLVAVNNNENDPKMTRHFLGARRRRKNKGVTPYLTSIPVANQSFIKPSIGLAAHVISRLLPTGQLSGSSSFIELHRSQLFN